MTTGFDGIIHYDGFNQLIQINQDDKEILYQYRGDGLRHSTQVRKLTKSQGKTNLYCWDGNDIVAEQTDGEQIKTYIRGINLIAGEFDRVVYYYILNEHGDVTQLWSQNGTCKASYEYDAFGVERNPDKKDENPFRYCGEYLDLETNSYYLRARNYRYVTGRFISEDTIRCVKNQLPNKQEVSDPLSLNLYTYCHNNPVRYTDPTGHLPFLIVAGLVGLAAGAIAGGISSAIQGKFSWEAVAQGAAIGGTIGLTGGAALAYGVTGSALASTGAVASGLGYGAATVGPAGATGFEQARQLLQAQQMRASEGAAKWTNPDGSIKWPTNDGFAGIPSKITLQPGMRIDRYGYEGGSFVSPEGISYSARSLAPGTELKPYNVYEVVKTIDAMGGKIAPWFDQPGGGIQYKLFNTIQELLDGGFIRKVGY